MIDTPPGHWFNMEEVDHWIIGPRKLSTGCSVNNYSILGNQQWRKTHLRVKDSIWKESTKSKYSGKKVECTETIMILILCILDLVSVILLLLRQCQIKSVFREMLVIIWNPSCFFNFLVRYLYSVLCHNNHVHSRTGTKKTTTKPNLLAPENIKDPCKQLTVHICNSQGQDLFPVGLLIGWIKFLGPRTKGECEFI